MDRENFPLLLPPSVAVAIHVYDQSIMGQTIQNCDGQCLILEYLVPFTEIQIRSDNGAFRFIPHNQMAEKQFCSFFVERDVSNFIQDQQIDFLDFLPILNQLPCIFTFFQFIDQS